MRQLRNRNPNEITKLSFHLRQYHVHLRFIVAGIIDHSGLVNHSGYPFFLLTTFLFNNASSLSFLQRGSLPLVLFYTSSHFVNDVTFWPPFR